MALARKRRVRISRGWSDGLDDLHDYLQCPPRRASVGRPHGAIVVTDDWPDQVPIGDAELRIIESGLRDELDALFGSAS
ncbi:MAG: hypothetical protein H0X36_09620 [Sphingomonadaceae bacterium]|nr:hypothetical protein [Sphingomonadaceae bacterium]